MAEAAAGMRWIFPAPLCPAVNFCFYVGVNSGGLLLAALGVQRYLGAAFPLLLGGSAGNRKRAGRTLLAVSGVIWVVACGHCSVVVVAE
ncbi:FFAR3 protein, partial [Rhipidura dahli]|nr:FFAR3 protein [Rhipidura dahli]